MSSQVHQEDWAIYFTTVHDDQIGSVLVDLGFISIAPIDSFSKLLTFVTYFNEPNEDGLTSESESDKINQIEDDFINLLTSESISIYTGRIKFGGKMHSYYYFEELRNLENKIAELKAKYTNYRFEHTLKEDADWTAYFEILYPSEFECKLFKMVKLSKIYNDTAMLWKKKELLTIGFTSQTQMTEIIS